MLTAQRDMNLPQTVPLVLLKMVCNKMKLPVMTYKKGKIIHKEVKMTHEEVVLQTMKRTVIKKIVMKRMKKRWRRVMAGKEMMKEM